LLSVLLGACASTPPPAAQNAPAGAAPGAAAPSGAAAAAASATGPVKMLASAEARSLELATVSITSLDRLLPNPATLVAKAVPLPIAPSGLRDMLLGQAGMPPEVSANLDLGAPMGLVVVATGGGGGNGLVLAVAARGRAEATRVVAALGRQVEKRG